MDNNELVKQISKEYRNILKLKLINKEITDINSKLNDKNISYQDFFKLSDDMISKENDYQEMRFVADVIDIAREIVMGYLCKN